MRSFRKFFAVAGTVVAGTLLLLSYSTGPGNAGLRVTGSPVDQGTCVMCHTSHPLNSGTGSITISGLTSYTPGSTYTMTVTVTNSSINRYGFQLVALVDANNNNAGSLTAGSGMHVVTLNGRQYIEHSTPSSSGVFTFTWTAPSTNVGSVTFYAAGNAAENPTGSPLGDYIYSTSLAITGPAVPPIADFIADTTDVCAMQNVFFTDLSTGTITSWQWDFGAGALPATYNGQTPPPVKYSTPGLKTVQLTVSGPAGSDVLTRVDYINVHPIPLVSITPVVDTICLGDSVLLTASGADTYTWSPTGSLSDSTGPMVWASPTVTTSYVVTGTTVAGCKDQALAKVVVAQPPVASVSPDDTICAGGSVQLTVTGFGPLSYDWSPSTGLSCVLCPDPVASPAVTTTYTVMVTNAFGCILTDSVTVTVNPLPVVSITGGDTVCQGSGAQLIASGASTYQWSPAGGLSCTSCPDPYATPQASTQYTVTATDANGCTATDSVWVYVLPAPNVSASGNVSICNGDHTQLTASGASSYSWQPSAGLSCTTCPDPVASPTTTTTYKVTGTDASGCTDTGLVTVTVLPLPNVSVLPAADTACEGSGVQIISSGGVFYSWQPAAGLSCSACPDPYATPVTSTTYTLTVMGANGCTATDSIHIEVEPTITLQVQATSDTLCAGQATTITVSGGTNYIWAPSQSLDVGIGPVVHATPSSTTTYTVTATSASGLCQDSATITITVNSQPTVSVTPSVASICQGDSVLLTASGAVSFHWSPAAGLSTTSGASVYAAPLSTTTYTVVGNNNNGCTDTTTVTVNVSTAVQVTVSPAADSICPGASVTLTASGAANYQWMPAAGLDTTAGAMVHTSPASSTVYTVIGTVGSGLCADTATVSIIVFPQSVLIFTASADSICLGETDTLSLSMPGMVTFQVIPAPGIPIGNPFMVTPGATTSYIATATDTNGCTDSDTLTVYVLPLPVVSLTQSADTLMATGGYANYAWHLNGNPDTVTGQNVLVVNQTGSWFVVVTDANGCSDTSNSVTYTSIPSMGSNGLFGLYPNPTAGAVNYRLERIALPARLEVFDISGRRVGEFRVDRPSGQLPLEDIGQGIYILQLSAETGVFRQKLVIE